MLQLPLSFDPTPARPKTTELPQRYERRCPLHGVRLETVDFTKQRSRLLRNSPNPELRCPTGLGHYVGVGFRVKHWLVVDVHEGVILYYADENRRSPLLRGLEQFEL